MRDWTVAGGLIESDDGLLLVCNRRRNGSFDWSPPGGVIEVADGESLLDGLTREVQEETGVRVTEWAGPVYEVHAEAIDLGWRLRAEVHVAVTYDGELRVEDPDGIVVDARYFALEACVDQLGQCHRWVREPLGDWLAHRWSHLDPPLPYGYRVDGADLATLVVTRVR